MMIHRWHQRCTFVPYVLTNRRDCGEGEHEPFSLTPCLGHIWPLLEYLENIQHPDDEIFFDGIAHNVQLPRMTSRIPRLVYSR
jgi:hypothetical protein